MFEYVETDIDLLLRSNLPVTEHHITKIIYNALCSISFMHILNVMHRDIKPANILTNNDCSIKICDLGLARCMPQGHSTLLENN